MNFKILTSIILCLFLSTKLIAQNKTGSEIIQVTKRDTNSKIYKVFFDKDENKDVDFNYVKEYLTGNTSVISFKHNDNENFVTVEIKTNVHSGFILHILGDAKMKIKNCDDTAYLKSID